MAACVCLHASQCTGGCCRDSVELQASYDTPGSSMKLLVLDNLLLAHHPSTGRTGASTACLCLPPAVQSEAG